MPRENLLEKYNRLSFEAGITPRTEESIVWFQDKVKKITRLNRDKLFRSKKATGNYLIGNMVMYFYDPKYEKELPYYDSFPLVIIIDEKKGGFLGLNLHYLPIDLRAKFLSDLLKITTDKKFNEKTRFAVTYEYLKRTRTMRYYKPSIKRYLTKHVQNNMVIIKPEEWEIATFLPTEQFQKETKMTVHKFSREMVR